MSLFLVLIPKSLLSRKKGLSPLSLERGVGGEYMKNEVT
jgi:hypothetical protein